MAGLDLTGFTPATFEEIRTDINEAMRSAFGPSIDLSDGSILGQIVAIVAERYATLWELAETVNSSTDPDAATGARLHAIGALTGTEPLAAEPSAVDLFLTGTPTTLVPTGSQASVSGTGEVFTTLEDATIVAATAWAGTTAYVVGDIVTNSSNIYICTVAGTSAASGGPSTTFFAINDGTVIWRYLGGGTGYIEASSEAEETGPTVATAYSISDIVTPVAGWNGVSNLLDADLGRDDESDEAFRIRRELELATSGTSTIDAIRADLLDVLGVEAVTVFANNTDSTDADGVPPHAIEALVSCEDTPEQDQLIFDQLLASVAAGIATHGSVSGVSVDSAGNSHTIKFSRPTEIEIYVDVTVTYDPLEYPEDGDDQIAAAIVAYGDAQKVGKDVVASALIAAAHSISGVLSASVLIDAVPSPATDAPIIITSRQLAVYDTSRITVNSSEGVP